MMCYRTWTYYSFMKKICIYHTNNLIFSSNLTGGNKNNNVASSVKKLWRLNRCLLNWPVRHGSANIYWSDNNRYTNQTKPGGQVHFHIYNGSFLNKGSVGMWLLTSCDDYNQEFCQGHYNSLFYDCLASQVPIYSRESWGFSR